MPRLEGDTRAIILRSATQLFRANGYKGTGVADIARSVNITNAALYYYFGSKDELLYWCLRDGLEGYSEKLREIVESERTAVEKLTAAVDNHFDFIFDRPDAIRVFLRERRFLQGENAEDYGARVDSYDHLFDQVLAEGKASGDLRFESLPMTRLAILGMINWVTEWYDASRSLSQDEIRVTFRGYTLDVAKAQDRTSSTKPTRARRKTAGTSS